MSVSSCVAYHQYYPKTVVRFQELLEKHFFYCKRWQRKTNVTDGEGWVKKLIKLEKNKRKRKRIGMISLNVFMKK